MATPKPEKDQYIEEIGGKFQMVSPPQRVFYTPLLEVNIMSDESKYGSNILWIVNIVAPAVIVIVL